MDATPKRPADGPLNEGRKKKKKLTWMGELVKLYTDPEPTAQAAHNDGTQNGEDSSSDSAGTKNAEDDEDDKDEMTGEPKFFSDRRALPVWKNRHAIHTALEKADVLVLSGQPGSGKSTQIPQLLCKEPWCTKMIAVTQPRRIAAKSLAYRVASEIGTPLGKKDAAAKGKVGYSVRFDSNVPATTKIKYLTEGMLLQEMLDDPSFSKYSAIIVDEVHERSINTDLLLGFLRRIVEANRLGSAQPQAKVASGGSSTSDSIKHLQRKDHPLKVVLMSATADVEKLCKFFTPKKLKRAKKTEPAEDASGFGGAADEAEPAAVETSTTSIEASSEHGPPASPKTSPPSEQVESLLIPGRQYPINIIYKPKAVRSYVQSVAETVASIHKHEALPGDILVFLPGQDDIDKVANLITTDAAELPSNVPRIQIFPLFSQLQKEQQDEALLPTSQPFTRKVILATNIAETSVTVPGVRYVVDSGMAKIKQRDPSMELDLLLNMPISQSSASQRAGRAGREGPGKCYREYTENFFLHSMNEVDLPEILRSNPVDAVLTMIASGVSNPNKFPLVDKLPKPVVTSSLLHLFGLGALTSDGGGVRTTRDGDILARMPLSAAYGRVLLEAAKANCLLEAIDIIACLTTNGAIFLKPTATTEANSKTGVKTSKGKNGKDGKNDEEAVRGKREHSEKGEAGDTMEGVEEEEDDAVLAARKELLRSEGDLLTLLTAMRSMLELRDRKWNKWCRDRQIHAGHMRQAVRIREQLRRLCVRSKILSPQVLSKGSAPAFTAISPEMAETLLKCFLRAFTFNTAVPDRARDGRYVTTRAKQHIYIHPSSTLRHRHAGKVIMFIGQMDSGTMNYARNVSEIEAEWIEDAKEHWIDPEEYADAALCRKNQG